jgi:PKD repeat protein
MSNAFLRSGARLAAAGWLVAATAACTIKGQDAPPLTGPSEFSQSIVVEVSPDVLSQDGASQSVITAVARGPNGEPLRNVSMRVEVHVNGTVVDFGSLSARNIVTSADGRASAVYTAPAAPALAVDDGTIVDIVVRPLGTDFNNASVKTAAIRLVPPKIVIPPDGLNADFTFSPAAPIDNQDVFFDASTSSGAIASFSWDFGDGRSGSGMTAEHKYDAAGTYHATLTISDQFGRTRSATRTIFVAAAANPTATFVFSPTAPRVNQNIAFNASASRAGLGQTIATYTCDFGDGTPRVTTTEPTINRVYTVANTYNVTLLVTDTSGKFAVLTVSMTIAP